MKLPKFPKLSPPVIIGGVLFVIVLVLFMSRSSGGGQTVTTVSSGPSEQAQIAAANIGLQREQIQASLAAAGIESQTQVALGNLTVQRDIQLATIQANDNVNAYEANLAGAEIQANLSRDLRAMDLEAQRAETEAYRSTTLASIGAQAAMFTQQVAAGLQQTQLLTEAQTNQALINANVLNNQFAYQRDVDLANIDSRTQIELDRNRTDRAAISGQNKRNRSNNVWGTIGGIAGAALSIFSDERLKYDVEQTGETPDGIPVYTYGIMGHKTTGVLATELALYGRDDILSRHGSGYQMVDYTELYA